MRGPRLSSFFLVGRRLTPFADLREAPRRPPSSFLRKGFSFPSPTRPASIRTLSGASAPVPVGVLLLVNGAAISEPNWTSPLETPVPPPCRSHPNPAIGSQKPLQHYIKLPVSNYSLSDCCAMVRTPLRIPTTDPVAPPPY